MVNNLLGVTSERCQSLRLMLGLALQVCNGAKMLAMCRRLDWLEIWTPRLLPQKQTS